MSVFIIFSVVVGFAVILFFFYSSRAQSKPKKLIPGWNNHPADPHLGDLGVALSEGSLHHYLDQQHQGGSCPVTSFWWYNKRVVSVCSPKAFKDTEHLYNRPELIFGKFSDPLHGSKSIQSVNYTEWEERKNLLHGKMRGRNLESFFEDFVKIAQETRKRWTPNTPIRVTKEMFRITLKAILNTSLGNIFKDDSDIEQLADVYHQCKCEMDTRILDVPPSDSQQELKFQKNLSHLREYLKKILYTCKEQKNRNELPLMDALLVSGSSEDQVLSDMVTFMAGFHTVSYYATWTFIYLAKYRDVQEKLFEEMKQKVNGDCNEKLKAYTFTANSYLRQVLDESLRMSTTAPFSAHFCDHDITVDGYFVPAKTPIIHAIGVALNNKCFWENAEQFDPDRFNPGSVHAKRGTEFRPFGISCTRRCPANQFTYLMISVYITILLQEFVFLTADGKIPAKKFGVATSPKGDPHFVVQFRKDYGK